MQKESLEISIRCPTCKKIIKYSKNNPFRPFCSERCRTLDLGAWAEESYKIPENQEKIEDSED